MAFSRAPTRPVVSVRVTRFCKRARMGAGLTSMKSSVGRERSVDHSPAMDWLVRSMSFPSSPPDTESRRASMTATMPRSAEMRPASWSLRACSAVTPSRLPRTSYTRPNGTPASASCSSSSPWRRPLDRICWKARRTRSMTSVLNPFMAARSPTPFRTTGISTGLNPAVRRRW